MMKMNLLSLRNAANMSASLPLKFEPGTKVQYSNIGIDTMAAVNAYTGRMK